MWPLFITTKHLTALDISIWNALGQQNINQKYIKMIKNIYANSTNKVRLETRVGEEIKIERGVRQGDSYHERSSLADFVG